MPIKVAEMTSFKKLHVIKKLGRAVAVSMLFRSWLLAHEIG